MRWANLVACQEDDRRFRKQRIPVLVDEFDSDVMHRDDDVELQRSVFQPEEIKKARLVLQVGKSPGVEKLRVVVKTCQALTQDVRQLALTGERNRRVSPGRIQDEHLFLRGAFLGPQGLGYPESGDSHHTQQKPMPSASR